MIHSRETPYDDYPGVPIALPILPSGLEGQHSLHHTAHPRDHYSLQGHGGKAVRVAIVQRVEGPGGEAAVLNEAGELPEYAGLHTKYHARYDGPPLPLDDQEKFGYCIMALAGYIPEQGIDLSERYPITRKITPKELEYLRGGELRVGSYSQIQDFFADHLLLKDDAERDPKYVNDFLMAARGIYRFQIGNRIIDDTVLNAVQPWVRPYKEARKNGRLRPDANPSVVELVRDAFGREQTRLSFIERMHTKLYRHVSGLALQTEVKVVPSVA
jgi:hypothetical protein